MKLQPRAELIRLICVVALVFLAKTLLAASPTPSFAGPCYFRLPGFRSFVMQNDFSEVPDGTLAVVRPDVQNPMATETKLLVGSYTVIMLPGASLKVLAKGFVPLAGRFVFAGEGDEPLLFRTRAFELYYRGGNLFLEITPDQGTFIALRNKGDVFVKGLNRDIYDLEPGQEVHFPLFGAAKLKKRLSGFWSDPPTGFSSARRRPDSTSLSDADAVDSEDSDNADQDEAVDETTDEVAAKETSEETAKDTEKLTEPEAADINKDDSKTATAEDSGEDADKDSPDLSGQ